MIRANEAFFDKPLFSYGLNTIITNLSNAIKRVDTVEFCTERNNKAPDNLHIMEPFHFSAA